MDHIKLRPFRVVLGEPKVCNFIKLVLYEDVGGFQIPVDDFVFIQIFVACYKLLDYDQGLCFGELLAVVKDILEGASVAQFLKQVDVVG